MIEVKIDKSFYYVVTSFCRSPLHTIFDRIFLLLFRIYTAEVSLFLLSFSAIIQGLVCVQLKRQFLSKRNYTEIKKASFQGNCMAISPSILFSKVLIMFNFGVIISL